MDISKPEQRVLHLLAQGGQIQVKKNEKKRIVAVLCRTREGWGTDRCSLELFRKLKRRRFIASKNGAAYRITQLGIIRVRSQPDNR